MAEVNSKNGGSNPFVGPRSILYGEALYGRQRETAELRDLLISERIVLLHSPSGAGKTSLIQAALVPKLEEDNFLVRPIILLRNQPPPEWGLASDANLYTTSAVLSVQSVLARTKPTDPKDFIGMSLNDVLQYAKRDSAGLESEVLIFDQFEDFIRIDPTNLSAKWEFIRQLAEVLRDRNRWALFAMREEYISALQPYLRPIPTRLSAHFRLELLGVDAARQAISKPSHGKEGEFTEGAAIKLVEDLRQVRVQAPDGTTLWKPGPYVEPVQLQVVCRRLWDRLHKTKDKITETDVGELESVDKALAGYYADAVGAIAAETDVDGRQIRQWFETALITKEGVRARVLKEAETSQGLDNRAIQKLVDHHVVRAEESQYRTWFELAHDRLVEPIRTDNAAWQEAHLTRWQRQATLWSDQGQPDSLLLGRDELLEAERWAGAHGTDLSSNERKYLEYSTTNVKIQTRIKTLVVTSLSAICLFFTAILYDYILDRQSQLPWAYFRSFNNGEIYMVSPNEVTIGRSTEFENTVNVPVASNLISRMHVLITRDQNAYDARSLNGTTINATFLEYGNTRMISDRDIIALAGVASFQYYTLQYPFFQFWDPQIATEEALDGWLLFIDGSNKKATVLEGHHYYLNKESGQFTISSESTGRTLMELRRGSQCLVEIFDIDDDHSLSVQFKASDYTYPSYPIWSGEWIPGFFGSWIDRNDQKQETGFCLRQGVFVYDSEDFRFQLVPLVEE